MMIFAGRSIALLVFLAVAGFSSAAGAQEDCQARVKRFFDERDVQTKGGKLVWSDLNLEFFHRVRDALRLTKQKLGENYFEMDHAYTRIFEASALKTHAYLGGDPGAAKTALLRDLLYPKRALPTGEGRADVFAIQLNQLMSDLPMRGYLDFDMKKISKDEFNSVKEKVKTAIRDAALITAEHIHNEGAAVHFSYVLLDELDKGNPITLAAALDILNEKIAQYGPVTVKVRTSSIFATSNMRIEEFIAALRLAGMESTARALMDRFPYKVLLPNWVTDPDQRLAGITRGHEKAVEEASNNLSNNRRRYEHQTAQIVVPSSHLPEVDWVWLGELALASSRFTDQARMVTRETVDGLREKLYAMRRASEEESRGKGPDALPTYYPPTIFSMRNVIKFSLTSIAVSAFLDLAALPEHILPTETLAKLCSEGITYDRLSTWRLQNVMLMAAPGDPILHPTAAANGGMGLAYGNQMALLAKDTFDERQKVTYEFVIAERDHFKVVFDERQKANQTQVERVSPILEKLLGAGGLKSNEGIEKYLNLVNPRPLPSIP